MAALEWNLYLNNDAVCVTILGNAGLEPTIKQTGEMDANTHAGIHCILEVARCLMKGISIRHYFNPLLDEEAAEVWVKCQWMRSGKLFCIGETTKKYHHCMKVEEAMMQNRTFTCTRKLYELVPKRRPSTKAGVIRTISRPAKPVTSEGMVAIQAQELDARQNLSTGNQEPEKETSNGETKIEERQE